MRKVLPFIAALSAVGMSTPALAADIWLDSDHSVYYGDQPNGATLVFSGGGVTVRATAWTVNSNGTISQARLGVWNEGLGVKTSSDNSHTVDNSGSKDFIVFQFDQVVELDYARLQTGWNDNNGNNINDTDATIGYNLNGSIFGANPSLHGLPQSTLNVMNLYSSNAPSGDSFRDINPNGYDGQLWVIGASFNNPAESSGGYCWWSCKKTVNIDGFKIEKLTFSKVPPPPGGVPEPSTWATMLLGFFGLGGAMRSARRKRKAEGLSDTLAAA